MTGVGVNSVLQTRHMPLLVFKSNHGFKNIKQFSIVVLKKIKQPVILLESYIICHLSFKYYKM